MDGWDASCGVNRAAKVLWFLVFWQKAPLLTFSRFLANWMERQHEVVVFPTPPLPKRRRRGGEEGWREYAVSAVNEVLGFNG